MSVVYCEKHARHWDSDETLECPLCELEDAPDVCPDCHETECPPGCPSRLL